MDEKKFTQADLNGHIKRAKAEWGAEQAKHAKELADRDTIITAARERIAELETAATAAAQEREQHLATISGFHAKRRSRAIAEAMDGANVFKPARSTALRMFEMDVAIECDELGEPVAATYKDTRYEDLTKAAEAFLKDHPYMLSAKLMVGGGTIPPGSVIRSNYNFLPPSDPAKQNPTDLITRGLMASEKQNH